MQDVLEFLEGNTAAVTNFGGLTFVPATFLRLQTCLLALLAADAAPLPVDARNLGEQTSKLAALLKKQDPEIHPQIQSALADVERLWPLGKSGVPGQRGSQAVLHRHLHLLPQS